MTGINDQQDVQGLNVDDFQAMGLGEPEDGRISAPQQPAAGEAVGEAGADFEVVQDRNRVPVPPSIQMFEKCCLIDRKLAHASQNPAQQVL